MQQEVLSPAAGERGETEIRESGRRRISAPSANNAADSKDTNTLVFVAEVQTQEKTRFSRQTSTFVWENRRLCLAAGKRFLLSSAQSFSLI